MKNLFFILAIFLTCTLSAQELTKDVTIALKNDSPKQLSALINDTNKNECLSVGTRQSTLLQLAVQMGSSDVILYLIEEAKVDVDKACDDNTPLMWAAQMGRINQVERLVQAGADKSIKVDGKTALDLAIQNKHLDVIKFLK